ncbi:MAG: response regulator transcription factor [Pseudomonadota bacterium]
MSTARHSVIVCDDEADVRETVGEYLEKRGYSISLVADGAELKARLEQDTAPDVVLLDVRMPGESGLEIVSELPPDRPFAVIMVSAAGETIDRVLGLQLGADDYLTKPVDLRELEARVQAAIRQKARVWSQSTSTRSSAAESSALHFFGLTLDFNSASLLRQNGEDVPLTAMEFHLLKVFARHRGRVLSRDQLLELAHDRAWDPFDRSIDIRISRLRRKIEPNPSKPVIIRTVRGLGYIFDPDGTAGR